MLITYFIIAAMSYMALAAFPFLVTKQVHIVGAIIFGMIANICWAMISRSVDQQSIPIVGLFYDIMLTLIFLLVPFIFIEFNLSVKQMVGALLIIIGIVFIK